MVVVNSLTASALFQTRGQAVQDEVVTNQPACQVEQARLVCGLRHDHSQHVLALAHAT